MDLKQALLQERLASYVRLRGGFPVPLAGAVYWAALGILGLYVDNATWSNLAFYGTGAIFPLALLFAAIFKNNFMKDKTAIGTLMVPAFVGMLLFWPMIIAAAQAGPEAQTLIPLILAIGLSVHWPVIGWMYGRPFIYTAHSVIRALVVLGIWLYWPEARLTLLPFSVAVIYILTVIIIYVDSGRMKGAS